MTTQELRDSFTQKYESMAKSKDVSKMRLFGTAFTNMFNEVADSHPEVAMATLDFLAAVEYNNYVTKDEAWGIASDFINDDTMITGVAEPSEGAHWNMDTLKSFLTQKGLPLEEKPYYNWCALWLTANMIYSDFANVIVEVTGKENEKIAALCYKMAVKKLKDLDRPSYIREYFDLD